jgi:arabinose-5-phosphate isomerase
MLAPRTQQALPGGRWQHASRVGTMAGCAFPLVFAGATMDTAVKEINRLEIGATLVAYPDMTLAGIITDGDIRRLIAGRRPVYGVSVDEVMTPHPRTLIVDSLAYDALNIMEKHQITVLPIVNWQNKITGILHLHDILGKGEFKFNGH